MIPGILNQIVLGGAAASGGISGATARQAMVLGTCGLVMINAGTTSRDANAAGVAVNSR